MISKEQLETTISLEFDGAPVTKELMAAIEKRVRELLGLTVDDNTLLHIDVVNGAVVLDLFAMKGSQIHQRLMQAGFMGVNQ